MELVSEVTRSSHHGCWSWGWLRDHRAYACCDENAGLNIDGGSSMTTTSYDLFISYARKDNVADSSGKGWVTGIKDIIEADSRAVQGREFDIFFDISEIHGMQDWKARILGSLRTSKVMLVCLSPSYYESEPCQWEWEEYRQRQARMMAAAGAGDRDDGTIATLFFVDMPGSDLQQNQEWRQAVESHHGVDLRPWFPDGAAALELEDVRRRVLGLGDDIWKRIERARRCETAVGNLMRFNPYFVGRSAELQALNHTLRQPGSIGVVTAVHGLGGLGKTELTVQYAHAYRDTYSGGVWALRAEGRSDILALAATLADEPEFGFTPTPEIANDPKQLGRAVLAELLRRTRPSEITADGARLERGDVLVIFDNVSDPALFAEPQVALLPKDPHLRFVATSRLGEPDFPSARGCLGFLQLNELSDEEGLTLIRDHQPVRAHGQRGFDGDAQEQAARELVRELGGFTLAIEQAAIYLGAHPDTTPSMFLAGIGRHGLVETDRLVGDDTAVDSEIRHQGKTLAAVLATTLADLDEPTLKTLRLASLLPPESVPLPWLKEMLTELDPGSISTSFNPDGGWARIQRTLVGRRLVTPGSDPDVVRMHRLHAVHLRRSATAEQQRALRKQVVRRASAIMTGDTGGVWEYGVLPDVLLPLLSDDTELKLTKELNVRGFPKRLSDYVGDDRPKLVALSILAGTEQLAAGQPGNLDAQHNLSIALTNVARVVQGSDPVQALKLFQRALGITEQLAAGQPGNLGAQRNLSAALNDVARVVQGSDPVQALKLFQRALGITEQLAAGQPGNLNAQRDLSIALTNVARVTEEVVGRRDAVLVWKRIRAHLEMRNARGLLAADERELLVLLRSRSEEGQ